VLGVTALMCFHPGVRLRPVLRHRPRYIASTRRSSTETPVRQGNGTKGPPSGLHDWCYLDWPISMSKILQRRSRSLDTRSVDPPVVMRRWRSSPSSPPWCQRQHRSKRWCGRRPIGGQSRTVFETGKTISAGSITTRQDPGWVAIATVRGWMLAFAMMAVSSIAPIRRLQKKGTPATAKAKTKKKRCHRRPLIRWSIQEIRPRRHQTVSKADPTAHNHRMVTLA